MNANQIAAIDAMLANQAAVDAARCAAPFRFEDLPVDTNGRRIEPEKWGPVYPALPSLDKWRKLAGKRELTADETRAYGAAVHAAIGALNAVSPRQGLNPRSMCASGQSGDFSAAKHRAKLRAELEAAANADRRALAAGTIKTLDGFKPEEAYAAAMEAKRARLARAAIYASCHGAQPLTVIPACAKPRYVLRNGAFVLAEAA
jgi:hypothetical protein